MYHRNIFGSSSKVFGNLRRSSYVFGSSWKMFGNVRLAFGTMLENLRKSSESGRKSSENQQPSSVCLYNEKKITRQRQDMNFMFEWQEQYLTTTERTFLPLEHKIPIFSPSCNILYLISLFTSRFQSSSFKVQLMVLRHAMSRQKTKKRILKKCT